MAIENGTTQSTNGDTSAALSRTVDQFNELQSLALASRALVLQLGGESSDVGATAIGMLARLGNKAAEFSSMADNASVVARKETPTRTGGHGALADVSVDLDFTAGRNIYQFHPEVKTGDIGDQLSMKQKHLEAALFVGSRSQFDYSDDFENFFWGCRMMSREISALTRELVRRLGKERKE